MNPLQHLLSERARYGAAVATQRFAQEEYDAAQQALDIAQTAFAEQSHTMDVDDPLWGFRFRAAAQLVNAATVTSGQALIYLTQAIIELRNARARTADAEIAALAALRTAETEATTIEANIRELEAIERGKRDAGAALAVRYREGLRAHVDTPPHTIHDSQERQREARQTRALLHIRDALPDIPAPPVDDDDVVAAIRIPEEIKQRDFQDMTRVVAPLRVAEDAVVIDTNELGVAGVCGRILKEVL